MSPMRGPRARPGAQVAAVSAAAVGMVFVADGIAGAAQLQLSHLLDAAAAMVSK